MNTFYFSHDYNARSDYKIKRLLQRQGACGYGVYWILVENLYNNDNSLPIDYEVLQHDLQADAEVIRSVLNDFDLFQIKDNYFSSRTITERLNKRNEKSQKARYSALARWDKTKKKQEKKPVVKRVVKPKEEVYREFDHLSISKKEYDKLRLKYSKVQIDNILDNICNFASNKKYKSLYITATNWLKNDNKKVTTSLGI